MDVFVLLTDADLAALADALHTGRLQGPYAAVAIQRYCSPAHASVVAARLQQLHDEGMQPKHLAS